MKKLLSLTLFISLGSLISLQAQPKESLEFLTVDIAEAFKRYTKAQNAKEKLEGDLKTAQEEINQMLEEGQALVQELEDLRARVKNPALTEEAREAAASEAAAKEDDIRKKQAKLTEFEQQTRRTLAQRERSIISNHLAEIKDIISQMAKERNVAIVFNSSGNTVIYAQEMYDITPEVIERINSGEAPE